MWFISVLAKNSHFIVVIIQHQPSPSINSIGIWHARYSRLTQRATLTIQFSAQACQPGATQVDTCPNNQLQTFCKASAICCMMSIISKREETSKNEKNMLAGVTYFICQGEYFQMFRETVKYLFTHRKMNTIQQAKPACLQLFWSQTTTYYHI